MAQRRLQAVQRVADQAAILDIAAVNGDDAGTVVPVLLATAAAPVAQAADRDTKRPVGRHGARDRVEVGRLGGLSLDPAPMLLPAAQGAGRQRTATEDKFTVAEQLTEWLDTSAAPHVRPSTLRRYRQIVKHQLLPAIGHIPLAELTAADVRKMLLDLHRGGLSARSVSHVRAVLRVALELAVGDDKIDKNPAKYARGPSVKTVEVQY